MSSLLNSALRDFLRLLILILQAGLIVWTACVPLVWILRDGLGPDAADSGWPWSVFKFAVRWGVPSLALALPLHGLSFVDRRLGENGPGNGRYRGSEKSCT
ncbi:hypothetical protein V5E97_35600 [Singulisphaera sp. Ch08]|uniref:Uncharacterized protein n=1 Tax=Singulisphaera sp. Ch08 TaxID=3120278 RepID=A0AAU7CDQ5_9BACT